MEWYVYFSCLGVPLGVVVRMILAFPCATRHDGSRVTMHPRDLPGGRGLLSFVFLELTELRQHLVELRF